MSLLYYSITVVDMHAKRGEHEVKQYCVSDITNIYYIAQYIDYN